MLPEKIGELYVGGHDVPFSTMKAKRELQGLDNKIIECRWEFLPAVSGQLNGRWVFMRERTDKSFPNSFKTASGNA